MHLQGRDVHQFLTISTLSPWTVVSELSLVKVPDDLPLDSLCLLGCGVGTGFGTAVNAAEVRPGDIVIVMGVGGVGINAVQGAAIAGARVVIAVDPVPFKQEMALKLGATHVFDSVADAAELARSLSNGQGADSAIVTVDRPTGEHVSEVFDAIGKSGIVVVAGVASQKASPVLPINLGLLVGYQKRIQGALFGMCSPAGDILRQIDMYRSGILKLDELVTRRYPLDGVNDAVDDLIAGRNIRGVIIHEH
jgi:S-(hydroxymethyl)glutathione dehydrogenase/alcohol dehydrogenase